jgi:selenocysteine lyase/cysteine desulfurase
LHEKNYKINSPLKREVRGASINFVPNKDARAISKELREEFGIATRLGNGLRVGPHLFNREEDFDALLATVEKIERSL